MTGDDRVRLSGPPDGVPPINDWNRLLDGKVAVVTGGGDGIGAGPPGRGCADRARASWQQMYDINLRHVFAVTRAFVPSMMEAGSGSIVTVHSVEGMRGYPKDPVYGAMKAAAAHFTTCLAVDLGRHGIRVNGIGTDLAQTPQVDYLTGYEDVDDLWASWAPVGRVGWPEDQARVALFLASDQSAFVTGHNIPADGGTKAGGGWLFSPRESRFVNRSRSL